MFQLDVDNALGLLDCYVNDPPQGHCAEIFRDLSYFYETYCEECGKTDFYEKWQAVFAELKLQPEEDFDDTDRKKLLKMSKEDIAYYASFFSFAFGMVYAEKLRLNFDF